MIKSMDELKDLVAWAESQGLKQLKVGDVEFAFSDYQLAKRVIEEASALTTAPTTEVKDSSKPMTDPDAKDIFDDPDLFHSTI